MQAEEHENQGIASVPDSYKEEGAGSNSNDDDDDADVVDPFEDTAPVDKHDNTDGTDDAEEEEEEAPTASAVVEEEHAMSVSAAMAQFDKPDNKPLTPDDADPPPAHAAVKPRETFKHMDDEDEKDNVDDNDASEVEPVLTAPSTQEEEDEEAEAEPAAEEEEGVFGEAWEASERRLEDDNEDNVAEATEPPQEEEGEGDDNNNEEEDVVKHDVDDDEKETEEPESASAAVEEEEDTKPDTEGAEPEVEEEEEAEAGTEEGEEPAAEAEEDTPPAPEEAAEESPEAEEPKDEKDEDDDEDEAEEDEAGDEITPLVANSSSPFDSAVFVEGGDAKDSDKKELKVSVVARPPASEPTPEKPKKSLRVLFYDLGSSDPDLVLETLTELSSMDLHDTHKENKPKDKALVAKGAAPMAVMQALRNHGEENAEIASKGLSLLLSLSATGEKGCEKTIVELEGTSTIIHTMKCHPGKVNIQVHGLGLLCNLSAMGKKEVATIAGCGGIDVVIDDMKAWPKLKYVQRRGCKILANMASEKKKLPNVKEEIRTKKGLSTMGRALETFSADSSTFVEARRAMQFFL